MENFRYFLSFCLVYLNPVLTHNIVNTLDLSAFSSCTLVFDKNTSYSRLEIDVQNSFIHHNANFPTIFQLGLDVTPYPEKAMGSRYTLSHCNLIIFIALTSATFSTLENSFLDTDAVLKFNTAIIVYKEENDFGPNKLQLLKRTPFTIFALKLETKDYSGSYYYLCLLCDGQLFPVKKPWLTMERSDLEYSKSWTKFEVFVEVQNPSYYIEEKGLCGIRPVILDQLSCL
jgi:hypothetical protein